MTITNNTSHADDDFDTWYDLYRMGALSGRRPNGVQNTFGRIQTVVGMPLTCCRGSTTHDDVLREELEIPADFRTQRHKDIFNEFFDIMFS